MLKQAKIQVSLDQGGVVRTAVESNVKPGLKLQLAAELDHTSDAFKCGYGLQMGD